MPRGTSELRKFSALSLSLGYAAESNASRGSLLNIRELVVQSRSKLQHAAASKSIAINKNCTAFPYKFWLDGRIRMYPMHTAIE